MYHSDSNDQNKNKNMEHTVKYGHDRYDIKNKDSIKEHTAKCEYDIDTIDGKDKLKENTVTNDNEKSKDIWSTDGYIQTRLHRRSRRELFTPLRVSSSPPARSLFTCRITTGRFDEDGERFQVIDSWTNRNTAHRIMSRPWTGKTEFILKREHVFAERDIAVQPITAGSFTANVAPVRGSQRLATPYLCSSRDIQIPVSSLPLCTVAQPTVVY